MQGRNADGSAANNHDVYRGAEAADSVHHQGTPEETLILQQAVKSSRLQSQRQTQPMVAVVNLVLPHGTSCDVLGSALQSTLPLSSGKVSSCCSSVAATASIKPSDDWLKVDGAAHWCTLDDDHDDD